MRSTTFKFGFCFIALALTGISCSGKAKPEVYPVKGTVRFKDKPAGGVVLTFFPVSPSDPLAHPPVAKSEKDGSFVLFTEDQEGAPAGDYIVTAIWMEDKAAPEVKKGETISMNLVGDPVDKLNGKYRDRKNGIKVNIKKGPNELEAIKLQ